VRRRKQRLIITLLLGFWLQQRRWTDPCRRRVTANLIVTRDPLVTTIIIGMTAEIGVDIILMEAGAGAAAADTEDEGGVARGNQGLLEIALVEPPRHL